MRKTLLNYFFNCGDSDIIHFALHRAHLNKKELEVICLMMDECCTQEEIAELMNYSTRRVQDFWYSASEKLLAIPWVTAYARDLQDKETSF